MTIKELENARDHISKCRNDYIEKEKSKPGADVSGLFPVDETTVLCEIAIDLKRILERLGPKPLPVF